MIHCFCDFECHIEKIYLFFCFFCDTEPNGTKMSDEKGENMQNLGKKFHERYNSNRINGPSLRGPSLKRLSFKKLFSVKKGLDLKILKYGKRTISFAKWCQPESIGNYESKKWIGSLLTTAIRGQQAPPNGGICYANTFNNM